ncbi:MAG: L-fucokinase, partial [Clostridia bacterium]
MSTIDAMHALFLRQSMEDCYSDFDYIRTHRRAVTWDDLVVTASNEAQARAYRLQIQYRLDRGFLPRQTHYHVIPDPEGRRVGSGGATLHVLCELAARQGYDAPFEGRRILVLHSGGDSKRVPQYSACGKLFSRVPRALPDGRASTLFDEFCIALAGVPARMSSGMLVMSGDVLLLFNALQVDLGLQGAACLSIKAPVETGTHHGVFLSDEEGLVRHFLHKLPVEKLEALGAVNAQRAVDIDTGAIWLDTRVMDALYGLVGGKTGVRTADFQRFVNEKVRLNFYGDFLYPMASGATLESYLHEPAENQPSEELHACRLALWETLHQVRLRLIRMSPAKFIHFGSTRELRTLMQEGERSFGFLDWRSEVQSVGVRNGAITAINCEIAPDAQVCTGCYLEDSRVCAGARIGEGCVLSNVDFSGILPADTVLHAVQLMDGRVVARIYGVADNPKAGLDGSWLSTTLTALMRGNALRDAEIFAGTEQTLWTARLYPVGANAAEALQGAFCALHMAEGTATAEECAAWRTAERWSLQESFEKADVQAMITWQTELE